MGRSSRPQGELREIVRGRFSTNHNAERGGMTDEHRLADRVYFIKQESEEDVA